MIYAFVMLLVGLLPSVLIFYLIGALLLKNLKLSKAALFVGFLAGWILSAVIALVISDSPTTQSALEGSVVAGLMGCVVALACVAVAGKRKE